MDTDARNTSAEKWILQLKLRNRAGVLSALTALFADRGVSLESLSAHDGGTPAVPGVAILTFAATAAKKDHLARLLARLSSVQSVAEFRYDDGAHARKSALARVALPAYELTSLLPPGLLCDIVSESGGETTALLLGPPPLLDAALALLTDRGALADSDATIIVV